MQQEALSNKQLSDINGLSRNSVDLLARAGYHQLDDLKGIFFPDIYKILSFEQAKILLKQLIDNNVAHHFSKPDWTDDQWRHFVSSLVDKGIVTWKEISVTVCGELNPPQVGTAIASNKSFQKKFPHRQTMSNVMNWLYSQEGKCKSCNTRLFLEADHIKSKQEFLEEKINVEEADTLDNLQLLCKRCNVIKRPSHGLGGISFAPAQSVLIWILIALHPESKEQFYSLCREYGLTMANIRFDEAWAFALWLKKENKY